MEFVSFFCNKKHNVPPISKSPSQAHTSSLKFRFGDTRSIALFLPFQTGSKLKGADACVFDLPFCRLRIMSSPHSSTSRTGWNLQVSSSCAPLQSGRDSINENRVSLICLDNVVAFLGRKKRAVPPKSTHGYPDHRCRKFLFD